MAKPRETTKTRPGEPLVCVTLKLSPSDRDALQREALRRRIEGSARRIDMSSIVRALIAEWRAGAEELRP